MRRSNVIRVVPTPITSPFISDGLRDPLPVHLGAVRRSQVDEREPSPHRGGPRRGGATRWDRRRRCRTRSIGRSPSSALRGRDSRPSHCRTATSAPRPARARAPARRVGVDAYDHRRPWRHDRNVAARRRERRRDRHATALRLRARAPTAASASSSSPVSTAIPNIPTCRSSSVSSVTSGRRRRRVPLAAGVLDQVLLELGAHLRLVGRELLAVGRVQVDRVRARARRRGGSRSCGGRPSPWPACARAPRAARTDRNVRPKTPSTMPPIFRSMFRNTLTVRGAGAASRVVNVPSAAARAAGRRAPRRPAVYPRASPRPPLPEPLRALPREGAGAPATARPKRDPPQDDGLDRGASPRAATRPASRTAAITIATAIATTSGARPSAVA